MSEKPKEPVVTRVDPRPCGCVITYLSDDSKDVNFCVACGLMRAAQSLAAVAQRVREDQNQATMARAVQAASQKGKK